MRAVDNSFKVDLVEAIANIDKNKVQELLKSVESSALKVEFHREIDYFKETSFFSLLYPVMKNLMEKIVGKSENRQDCLEITELLIKSLDFPIFYINKDLNYSNALIRSIFHGKDYDVELALLFLKHAKCRDKDKNINYPIMEKSNEFLEYLNHAKFLSENIDDSIFETRKNIYSLYYKIFSELPEYKDVIPNFEKYTLNKLKPTFIIEFPQIKSTISQIEIQ